MTEGALNVTRTLSEDESSFYLSPPRLPEASSVRNALKKNKGEEKTAKVAKSKQKTKLMDEVCEAVASVGERRKGASSQAIKNYILGKREGWIKSERRSKILINRINTTLRQAIEDGDLVRPTTSTMTTSAKGRFLLPNKKKKSPDRGVIENEDLVRPTASKLTAATIRKSLLSKKTAAAIRKSLLSKKTAASMGKSPLTKKTAAAMGKSPLTKKTAAAIGKSLLSKKTAAATGKPLLSKKTAAATGKPLLSKKLAKVSNTALREVIENEDLVRPTTSKLTAAAKGKSLLPKGKGDHKVAKVSRPKVSNKTLGKVIKSKDLVSPTVSKLTVAVKERSLLPTKAAKVSGKPKAKRAQDTKELAPKKR